MTVVLTFPLRDGPLAGADHTLNERASIVGAMAFVLIENRAYADQGDSIMALVADGRWSTAEIMMLLADARAVGTQHAVEMEMCWS